MPQFIPPIAAILAALALMAHGGGVAGAWASGIPVPEPSPRVMSGGTGTGSGSAGEAPVRAPLANAQAAEAFRACSANLAELGVNFRQGEPVRGDGNCGIAFPVEVSAIAPGIALEPPAILRCETALALSRWTQAVARPAASTLFPRKTLTAMTTGSSYACRGRNNDPNAKPSEHGLGNAIDISGFRFSDGSTMAVSARERTGGDEEAFQKAVRYGGCVHFTTVLGPGSDPYHDDHLHFDLADRRNGYRLCRLPEPEGPADAQPAGQ